MRLAIAATDAARLSERMRTTWRHEPQRMVRELFGATPDPWQDRFFEAFPARRRHAAVTCTSSGKTFVEAMLAWNLLLTRPHCQGKATSMTEDNLRDNLWKELAVWYGRSPLLRELFEVRGERIVARGYEKTWFLSAATWNRSATAEEQGEVLAGLHAPYVFFLLDEAGGIPRAVVRKAENVLADATCEEAHVVMMGNPLDQSSALGDAAIDRAELWDPVFITGDPDDPERAPRVSMEWAREQIDSLGRDNPEVQVFVLGRFPSSDSDALVTIAQFEQAFGRWGLEAELATLAKAPKTLGVDVASGGGDRTVVFPRAGDFLGPLEVKGERTWWTGKRPIESASRIIEIAKAWAGKDTEPKKMPIYVDDTGIGEGVTDQLRAKGYNARAVVVESRAGDADRHANLKSEIGIRVQERFREGRIAIHPSVKRGTTLMAEGSSLKVRFSGGRRRVEGKQEYKRRTGRSTDFWDAFMLAFAGEAGHGAGKHGRVQVGEVAEGESVGFLEEEF